MGQDRVMNKDAVIGNIEGDQRDLRTAFKEQNAVAAEAALHKLRDDLDYVNAGCTNQKSEKTCSASAIYDQVVTDISKEPENKPVEGLPLNLIVLNDGHKIEIGQQPKDAVENLINSKGDEVGMAHLQQLAEQKYHTDVPTMISQDVEIARQVHSGNNRSMPELKDRLRAGLNADKDAYLDLLTPALEKLGFVLSISSRQNAITVEFLELK